jgi:hypothetical protein
MGLCWECVNVVRIEQYIADLSKMFAVTGAGLSKIRHMQNGGREQGIRLIMG